MTRWMLAWILEGSWVDFGRILGRFWEGFGGQDGSKITKKSKAKHHKKNTTKKVVKIHAGKMESNRKPRETPPGVP